jgi:hypothetical protein
MKQDREIRNIADLAAQRLRADLLLEDGSHPFECDLPRLLAPVRLWGDA